MISKSVKIHSTILAHSPMKNTVAGTSKYFHGQLTDGKMYTQIVGYDLKIHYQISMIAKNLSLLLSRQRQGKIACNNNNVHKPHIPASVRIKRGYACYIVACYHPLPCCTLFLCFLALQSLHPSENVFTLVYIHTSYLHKE